MKHLSKRERQVLQSAQAIAGAENVFALVADVMRQCGFAGDSRDGELLYTIFTSRLLQRPLCASIQAPPSGNTSLLNRTLDLFPADAYELTSGVSLKAVVYGRTDLRHRVLVVQDASGLAGRDGIMLVRMLMSERQIRWERAQRSWRNLLAHEVKRPGPIAFVRVMHQTMQDEDELCGLSIAVQETREHARLAIAAMGLRFAGERAPPPVDLAAWHAYQHWLSLNPRETVIPFAPALSGLFFRRIDRAERDCEQVLTATAVSALMHQARRERDKAGRVVATIEDYAHARRVLDRPLNEASGTVVPAGVRELVGYLLEHSAPVNPHGRDLPGGLDLNELAAKMNVDKSVAQRRGGSLAGGLVFFREHRERCRAGFAARPLEGREAAPAVPNLGAHALDVGQLPAEGRGITTIFIVKSASPAQSRGTGRPQPGNAIGKPAADHHHEHPLADHREAGHWVLAPAGWSRSALSASRSYSAAI
ncbi:MAG TPA: hypothetical protein VGB82_26805 [Alphaproteobacteria bacterium]